MKNVLFSGMGCQAITLLISICTGMIGSGQNGVDRIQLNQCGFFPASTKIAVITGVVDTNRFSITSVDTKKVYYRGLLSPGRQSNNSPTITRIADFSSFKKAGRYVIHVPGLGTSYPFRIDNDVFDDVSRSALKAFYFFRSDAALEKSYAGKWSRGAGHRDTSVVIHSSAAGAGRATGTTIASPGGWYDAGDYNKYIVNSGITMATLLSAYEDFPAYFNKLHTNIPESEDRIPDIINEVLYNLRWMLTMQDPNDGGVYHKLTNAAFDDMVMPGVTTDPRYVVQKSTAATLDFAAVCAQAVRILRQFQRELPGLADSCLSAAVKAWGWAKNHPAVIYDQKKLNSDFDPDITTGDYGDRTLSDEWFWCAVEMFITTSDLSYRSEITSRMNDRSLLPGWSNVRLLGFYTLLRSQQRAAGLSSQLQMMKDTVTKMAEDYLSNQRQNAFATVMGGQRRDFVWGSNSVAANQGILLINAYLVTKDRKYLTAALSNLDYILGRNATNFCFVTGIGSKSPMYPHHRPSQADKIGEPIPGMLVGGPNPGQQDRCRYTAREPELSYVDSVCSYASNEIAINWNAPLVYLVNALQALLR